MTEADKYLAICLRIRYKRRNHEKSRKISITSLCTYPDYCTCGCQDKKESGKEFANNESSTETKAEPTMGGSIVVGIT